VFFGFYLALVYVTGLGSEGVGDWRVCGYSECWIACYIPYLCLPCSGVTWWHSRLRHCTTSQKVAGLNPDGVTGIFHWHNPSGHTIALGSNQPLTEIGGKGNRFVKLTTLPPSCASCLEIWESQLPRTLRSCPGLYRYCFTFAFTSILFCCFI